MNATTSIVLIKAYPGTVHLFTLVCIMHTIILYIDDAQFWRQCASILQRPVFERYEFCIVTATHPSYILS